MKLISPPIISLFISAISALTPILVNKHEKLNHDLLLAPLAGLFDKDADNQLPFIVESKVHVVSDDTLKLHFEFENNQIFQGILDLDNLKIYNALMKNLEVERNPKNIIKFSPQTLTIENSPLLHSSKVVQLFQQYLAKFGFSEVAKTLDNSGNGVDYYNRYTTFAVNMIRAEWMNLIERGSATYGLTPFSDVSPKEFEFFYKLPKNMISNHLETKIRNFKHPKYDNLLAGGEDPTDFDWRQKGAVTEVKNQGMCGSCWSFSTTGNIEGVHAVATGDLISLSEQELVDCDKTDQGCNGGLMDNAFEQIEKLGGLETEEDYSYKGKQSSCKLDKSKIAVEISGYHDVPVGDEVAMKAQLLETGPLAVALNAMWMQFYTGGVSHPWKHLCSPKMLDHGVLIVGYGVEPADPNHVPLPRKEQPFWTIKNSWGPGWGEDGYYRLYRGDGTCGIDQYVTTAEN